VKSTFRLFTGAATLGLTVLLSACGQPGPLYLPKAPAAKPARSGDAPIQVPGAIPVPAPVGAPATAPQQ
jgi:predicted small lipoprotein YifL